MSAPAVPRILMLHGYTQNADIFRKRLSALRKTCGKAIEFVFVDAPVVLYPADLAETFGTAAPSTDDASNSGDLAALGAAEATAAADDPKLTPRAWWKANAARTKTDGMDESVVWLRDLLKEQKFDGIFGFSQGAAMAVILAGLLEKPEVYPQFLVDGQAPHPPFKFCVSVSGFEPAGEIPAAVFKTPINTPTLHVIGKNDIVVAEERSRKALDLTTNGRVEWHDGGHFVPSKANWRNFLKAYLLDPLGDVPGPGPGPAASEPPSGAATPSTAANM
ncbi:FSH1-domain-containing protein [Dentipellis sp. KUC8613]|nr:FSH1-domain-containing protein [Dentipellis sp. KUC8613]